MLSVHSRLNHFPLTNSYSSFFDFTLNSSSYTIQTSRIFLSSFSLYFKDLLTKCNQLTNHTIPYDPDNLFYQVYLFFQTGTINISIHTLAPFLSIADKYQISLLKFVCLRYFKQILNHETLLSLLDSFQKFNLLEYNNIFLPFVLDKFQPFISKIKHQNHAAKLKIDEFRKYNFLSYDLISMLKVTSTDLLVLVLKHPSMAISVSDKLMIIDQFCHFNTQLSQSQHELLTTVINWNSENIPHLISKYSYDWIPPKLARQLISRTISTRRNDLKNLKRETNNSSSIQIGRWYIFAWLDAIQDVKIIDSSPQISIIKFISRLGSMNLSIDPYLYGFIDIFGTKPATPNYTPENILYQNKYFMSIVEKGSPFLGFSFGKKSPFTCSSLTFKYSSGSTKIPNSFEIYSGIEQNEKHNEQLDKTLTYTEDNYVKVDFNLEKPFTSLIIERTDQPSYNFSILRVLDLEIKGRFICK